MAAIAELRKSYAGSRWLDDAKALEVEVKQAAGQKVSPESESDEDLKLMAINGLMQSDSERAIPLLERAKQANIQNVVPLIGDDAKGILQKNGLAALRRAGSLFSV